MRLLTSSLMVVVLVALLVVVGVRLGTRSGAPAWDTIRIENNWPQRPLSDSAVMSPPVMSRRGDVAEVVVTAERPAGMMPEVVVHAGRMPEVVVRAASARTTVLFSARYSDLPVN